MGADDVCVVTALVQPVRANVITAAQAKLKCRDSDPPLRPVSVAGYPLRQDVAATPSLGRFVGDAVGIEEARRAGPRECPDDLIGCGIDDGDPAVEVVTDRDAIACDRYGD